jgi:hypothetical protein
MTRLSIAIFLQGRLVTLSGSNIGLKRPELTLQSIPRGIFLIEKVYPDWHLIQYDQPALS